MKKEFAHERDPHPSGSDWVLVFTPGVYSAKIWNIHLTEGFLSGDKQA
jgi:hypothetical protein